jgi:hypothetical protein
VDLTPAEKIGSETYARWLAMPNRGAYVRSFVGAAARDAYQAGREDAARERDEEPSRLRLALAAAENAQCGCLGGTLLEFADQGDQPRTVEEGVGDNPEEQRP